MSQIGVIKGYHNGAQTLANIYDTKSDVAADGYLLIRHNSANFYIPLTTDAANTTKPHLVTRHGSTNYYAIK